MVLNASRRRLAGLSVFVSVVVVGAAGAAESGAQVTAAGRRIVARPANLMVNGTTQLTGTGFPARSRVVLSECGATNWIAPRDPCDTTNTVTVTTGGGGGFTTPFKVQLCPRSTVTSPVTEETCYIGEIHPSGIDTIALLGAAKVIVTYP